MWLKLQGLVRLQQGLGLLRCLLLKRSWGPEPLEGGVVFSTHLADRIFRETGVRANYRARKQQGKQKLTRSGPAHKLEKALQLVNRYGREWASIGRLSKPGGAHEARRAEGCGRTLFAQPRETMGERRCCLTMGIRKV